MEGTIHHITVGTTAAVSQNHRRSTTNQNSISSDSAAALVSTKANESQSKNSVKAVESDAASEEKQTDAESSINETIQILLDQHIVENRKLLHESWINLDKIADYCDANYLQSDRKDVALNETKNYTTRALASVANQIHNFASNLITLFDLQLNGMNELETRANSLGSQIRFHEERNSRREIGKLTKPKLLPNPTPKVIKPMYPERYAAKKRRTNYYSLAASHRQDSVSSGGSGGGSIDYSILDDIGEAHRIYERRGNAKAKGCGSGGIYSTGTLTANGYAPGGGVIGGSLSTITGGQASAGMAGQRHWMPTVKSATLRPSKSSNLSALYPNGPQSQQAGDLSLASRTPAPTARPPTPPLGSTMSRFSSLSRGAGGSGTAGSKDYRSLGLIVAPPQLPNNYQKPNPQPVVVQSVQSKPIAVQSKVSESQPKTLNLKESSQPVTQTYRSPSTNPFLNDSQEVADAPSQSSDTSWIPSTYIQKVVALYDYAADKDDELTFKENSVIYVTAKNDDGWWEGVMNGITGLFPGNYVEPCFW